MAFENIRYVAEAPLATLTLNRPRVLNALNQKTLSEIAAAVETFAADSALRVLLITGEGEKAFAAGADISELAGLSAAEGLAVSHAGQAVFNHIERCGKPVIACINGFALGGGCELAMACTLRLASETAQLGQPEIKLGLIPGYGGTQRLPRLVGQSRALRLLLTGERITAAEAMRIGLVDAVYPAAELMAEARKLAGAMAESAPLATTYTLKAVLDGGGIPLDQSLAVEAEFFGRSCATADKEEGTRAFLEKRTPIWQGK